MNHVIGKCSICGGDVAGHVGVWAGIIPPPPPKCTSCGAVTAASQPPLIPMVPVHQQTEWPTARTTTGTRMPFVGVWRA